MNELILFESDNLAKVKTACEMLSKSNMVPIALRGKVSDIFSVVTMGIELGLPPMQALNSINVIQGKPTMGTQLMLALVRDRVKDCDIKFELDSENLTAKCKVKRIKKDEDWDYIAEWNMPRAATLGLIGRDQYKKQPLTMLKWRAASEACRAVFPDVLMGMYSTEESLDFEHGIDNGIDQDFPIPEEDSRVGSPEFKHQSGKFRGKRNNEINHEELEKYLDTLEGREPKGLKSWENELITNINKYLTDLDAIPV